VQDFRRRSDLGGPKQTIKSLDLRFLRQPHPGPSDRFPDCLFSDPRGETRHYPRFRKHECLSVGSENSSRLMEELFWIYAVDCPEGGAEIKRTRLEGKSRHVSHHIVNTTSSTDGLSDHMQFPFESHDQPCMTGQFPGQIARSGPKVQYPVAGSRCGFKTILPKIEKGAPRLIVRGHLPVQGPREAATDRKALQGVDGNHQKFGRKPSNHSVLHGSGRHFLSSRSKSVHGLHGISYNQSSRICNFRILMIMFFIFDCGATIAYARGLCGGQAPKARFHLSMARSYEWARNRETDSKDQGEIRLHVRTTYAHCLPLGQKALYFGGLVSVRQVDIVCATLAWLPQRERVFTRCKGTYT
jgi:hypothetical protein